MEELLEFVTNYSTTALIHQITFGGSKSLEQYLTENSCLVKNKAATILARAQPKQANLEAYAPFKA